MVVSLKNYYLFGLRILDVWEFWLGLSIEFIFEYRYFFIIRFRKGSLAIY